MKPINFYDYAYNAIHNSIIVLEISNNNQDIIDYYGDSKECTIENYFSAQTDGINLYDSTDEFSEHTIIGPINELRNDFDRARETAFSEFLNDSNNMATQQSAENIKK